ncbi:MAG: YraN family protein, partial [Treponemataceae bacterium]|nr:YraN family protein [Treponemataceae bacterium]
MIVAKISTRAVGNAGEDKACLWLRSHGDEMVARNWRTRRGEI